MRSIRGKYWLIFASNSLSLDSSASIRSKRELCSLTKWLEGSAATVIWPLVAEIHQRHLSDVPGYYCTVDGAALLSHFKAKTPDIQNQLHHSPPPSQVQSMWLWSCY